MPTEKELKRAAEMDKFNAHLQQRLVEQQDVNGMSHISRLDRTIQQAAAQQLAAMSPGQFYGGGIVGQVLSQPISRGALKKCGRCQAVLVMDPGLAVCSGCAQDIEYDHILNEALEEWETLETLKAIDQQFDYVVTLKGKRA